MGKEKPRHVLALLARALRRSREAKARKAAKTPTLAQRIVPRKGHR